MDTQHEPRTGKPLLPTFRRCDRRVQRSDGTSGLLIFVEGIDGSGKSTIVPLLKQKMEESFDCRTFAQPSQEAIGRRIRELARAGRLNSNPLKAITLFAVDRYEQMKSVEADLDQGLTVILDRSHYSSAAYQSNEHITPEMIVDANEEIFRAPDIIVFLDLNPAEAIARIESSRKQEDLEEFEKLDILVKIQYQYRRTLRYAHQRGVNIAEIDAMMDPSIVCKVAMEGICKMIFGKEPNEEDDRGGGS